MNDQQRATMQMALEALQEARASMQYGSVYDRAITALRSALAQPQGEWVDLTPHEVTEQIREGAADGGWQGFAQRITAKFKSKNTPPVVPQGEPVAWYYKQTHVYLQNACDAVYIERVVDKPKSWEEHPLYFTPPSVEAMRIETLEKAAKVCDELYAQARADEIAAAIRERGEK